MTVIIRYNPDLIPHKAVLGSGCTELTFSVLSWLSVLLSFHHRPMALFFLSFQCTLSGNSVISKAITVFSSSSSPFPLTRFHLALLVLHFTLLTIVFLKLSAPSALVRPHSRVPPTNLVAYSQSLCKHFFFWEFFPKCQYFNWVYLWLCPSPLLTTSSSEVSTPVVFLLHLHTWL